MGSAVMVEIDLHWDPLDDAGSLPLERVLRLEGEVVRHDSDGSSGFAVMATHTSIEPSSLVFEGLV